MVERAKAWIITSDAKYELERMNAPFQGKMHDVTERWWKSAHLENGFYGCRMEHLAEAEPLTQQDIIRIWGLSKFLLRQVGTGVP